MVPGRGDFGYYRQGRPAPHGTRWRFRGIICVMLEQSLLAYLIHVVQCAFTVVFANEENTDVFG